LAGAYAALYPDEIISVGLFNAAGVMRGLGTFVLKLPGDIGEIIVSKKQSTFCTNVPENSKHVLHERP